jgi:hypothetical protein
MGLGLNDSILNSILNAFLSPIQEWLSQHPQIGWLLANPVWLLVALIVALFLLSGLLRAVASLTEKLWLGLLKLPIRLVQWTWRGSLLLLRRPFAKPPQTVQPNLIGQTEQPKESASERLTEVLERLELLRREQDELMQEIKLLLARKLADGEEPH